MDLDGPKRRQLRFHIVLESIFAVRPDVNIPPPRFVETPRITSGVRDAFAGNLPLTVHEYIDGWRGMAWRGVALCALAIASSIMDQARDVTAGTRDSYTCGRERATG